MNLIDGALGQQEIETADAAHAAPCDPASVRGGASSSTWMCWSSSLTGDALHSAELVFSPAFGQIFKLGWWLERI
jgi:hypothetical protein